MDSWDSQMSTPNMKFEHSPAESFLSTPGEMYPPLFGSSSAATTLNPLEIMTPQSFSEERNTASSVPPETPTATSASTSEKKQTKKRKSWGQVLPEPKTNLPPRKRAKTEDEKEQRRVERVLRNRRAAQSSRERKRLEVEALEERNKELEDLLRQVQQTNLVLVSELQKVQQGAGVVSRTSPSFNPVTFSQELFSSQDGHSTTMGTANRSIEEILLNAQSNNTVNPASLSPTLTPVADEDSDEDSEDDDDDEVSGPVDVTAPATTVKPSPDATQHPAAMLCVDLQCRSAEEAPRWMPAASPQPDPAHPAQALFLPFQLLLATTSVMLSIFQRPLMQIAMCLRAGSSLPPTPSILNTIIWLVTTPLPSPSQRQATIPTSTSSTSTTTSTTFPPPPASSSMTTRQQQRTQALPQLHSSTPTTSLRLKSLRKILSSSPTLARPLLDATMEALRLASSEGSRVDRVSAGAEEQRFVGKSYRYAAAAATTAAASGQRQEDDEGARATWPDGTALPSRDVLLTLLWAITVEQKRTQLRRGGAVTNNLKRPGGKVVPRKAIPTSNYVLKVVPGDRASSVA